MRRAYFFTAKILRNGMLIERQGTINANDELEAIDRVYEMAKSVWKRICSEVIILGNGTGEVLATSTISDRVGQNLLPHLPEAANEDNEVKREVLNNFPAKTKPIQVGMAPWSYNDSPYWGAHSFGTYFQVPTFGRLTSFK